MCLLRLIGFNKGDAKYLNGSLCQLCSFANESANPLKESLAYSLVSLYFSLRWVSLAEYFLVLMALFLLLLQMVRCTTVIASIVCTLRWAITRTKGMVAPYVLSDAFVGHDCLLALYLN
jgi:hypothetical protein